MNIKNITDRNIIVAGDYMLDKYVLGKAIKISPEAPVPVVLVSSDKTVLGGAGNVISNLHNLGINVFSVGITGNDLAGDEISEKLEKISDIQGLHKEDIMSSVKMRIIADNQHVVRVDKEKINEITEEMRERVMDSFISIIENNRIDGVIFEDYGKGLFGSSELLKRMNAFARSKNIFTTFDPCLNSLNPVKGFSLLKPNLYEAYRISRAPIMESDENLCSAVMNRWNPENLLITKGPQGMLLKSGDSPLIKISSEAKEVFDVSGAGDTVIAVMTACMVSGMNPEESARIANASAGIVISKLGTAPITIEEFSKACENL